MRTSLWKCVQTDFMWQYVYPRFCVWELAGVCIVLRANKLKCNAVAHLLHRNVKATSEEKSSRFLNPTGLPKTGNLLRCGRFAVCAYTCTSRALHLACFGQSQNLGLQFGAPRICRASGPNAKSGLVACKDARIHCVFLRGDIFRSNVDIKG